MNKSGFLRDVLQGSSEPMTIEQIEAATGDADRKRLSTLLSQQVKRGYITVTAADGEQPKRWQWLGDASAVRKPRTKATRKPRRKAAPPAPVERCQVHVNITSAECVISHGDGALILDHCALVDLIEHLPFAAAALEGCRG